VKNPLIALIALGIVSCTPKAEIVAVTPSSKPIKSQAANPQPKNLLPALPNDDMRIGDDILALPSDDQLRSSSNKPDREGEASVIVRPPSE